MPTISVSQAVSWERVTVAPGAESPALSSQWFRCSLVCSVFGDLMLCQLTTQGLLGLLGGSFAQVYLSVLLALTAMIPALNSVLY